MDDLDALLHLPTAFGAKVAPSGAWVAWSWKGTTDTIEVFTAPTDGSQPPLQMTATDENTFLIGWRPDGKGIVVAEDENGNERFQLFMVMLDDPQNLIRLTEPDPSYYIRGGDLHPDCNWIVFGANYDPDTAEEIEPTQVIRLNLQDGHMDVLASPDKGGYHVPSLSPDGKHILYSRLDQHPAGRQLWLVGFDGENDRELVNVGADKKVFGKWCPDSERIVVRAETDTHQKIGLYHLQDETLHWLLDDPTRNIEGAFMPNGTDNIVIMSIQNATLTCSLLNPATGAEKSLPSVDGNLAALAPVGDDWICAYYSATQPADIIRLRPDGSYISLTQVWEYTDLSADDLTPAEDFRWQAEDGLEIQGWLFRTTAPHPQGTIIYVHGGPTAHIQNMIYASIQYFVKQGFNVLAPNYRGSTGFSLAFRNKIIETKWGGLEQEDIRTGILALMAAGIAERGKIGITGTSYGGYSSWCGITRWDTATLAAAVPICGMTDLVVDYETTRPDLRPYSEEMLGGAPDDVPKIYYDRSPINFIENIEGRLMIVQGLQDPNVSPENVRAVTAALQEHGVEYELMAFEDEGHGVYRAPNQAKLYRAMVDFFASAFA